MKANEVLRAVVNDCDLSMVQISQSMGRSRLFVGSYVSKRLKPNIELMAEICDATGHELIVRNKITGSEITIDPPGSD